MFSVLLSLYIKEHPEFLKQSLDSLFTQTLPPDEIVLVLDGPLTQELNEVVSAYATRYDRILKVVPLPQNLGLGRALNEGLKHCSYELVARMDTDDIAKPERFAKQIAIFEKYPEVDVVSAWLDEFEGDVSRIRSIKKLPEWDADIRAYAKRRNPINHPVAMFRKKSVLSVGGYLHYPLLEDYYLWVRMLMNGAKFYNIQESLSYFRFSPDMFKRRGGWRYALTEFRFQWLLKQIHFISCPQFVTNVLIRFTARIIPNSLRTFVYTKMLRHVL